MKKRGRKAVVLSCVAALAIAALLAALGRRQIAGWLDPPEDARRAQVTLDVRWDEKHGVRCGTRPYLRPDGTWLDDLHEFSTDPGSNASPDGPALDELETYLEFRKRDRARWFDEPRRLSVLVNYDREVPWRVVVDMIELCRRLGISDIDIDSDD